jgi:hypothetical protein
VEAELKSNVIVAGGNAFGKRRQFYRYLRVVYTVALNTRWSKIKRIKNATTSFVLSKRLSWFSRTDNYTSYAQSFYWLPTSRKIYYQLMLYLQL